MRKCSLLSVWHCACSTHQVTHAVARQILSDCQWIPGCQRPAIQKSATEVSRFVGWWMSPLSWDGTRVYDLVLTSQVKKFNITEPNYSADEGYSDHNWKFQVQQFFCIEIKSLGFISSYHLHRWTFLLIKVKYDLPKCRFLWIGR